MKKILFISTAFPESQLDFKGVFIKDYLYSIKDKFICSIFVLRMIASKRGYQIEKSSEFTTYRYAFFSHDVNKILKWISYPFFLLKSLHYIKKIDKPDAIHVHGALFIAGIIGLVIGKKFGIPVFYTEHMGRFETFYNKFPLRFAARFLLSKFSKITVVSSFTCSKVLALGVPANKVTIINNPVDTDLFVFNNQVIKGNTIVFVGRLDENKGIIRCLYAFKNLMDKYPKLKFLIIGDGNQRNIVEKLLIKDQDLKSRVHITGLLEKKVLSQMLSQCQFLIAPSIVESFGIAVAEAMACGLPVIVGKNNGTSDFVDEEVGLLIDPTNILELTNAMDWLILNISKFDPLKIRTKIVNNYCFEETGKKLSALYHSTN